MHIEASTRAPPKVSKDASTDRDQVGTWWKQWPDANIGIATGSSSGIFVVDVDGRSGRASLEALRQSTARFRRRSRSRPVGEGTFTSVVTVLRWETPPVVWRRVSISGATGAMWSAPAASTQRGPCIASSNGRAPREIEVAAAPARLLALISKPNSTRGVEGEANADSDSCRQA